MNIEEYTMKNILDAMLSRVPDSLDKREGSIIYDALAPAAFELSTAYGFLAEVFDHSFVMTATGDYLDRRVAEMGLSRKAAVKALRRASFFDSNGAAMTVETGARFSSLAGAASVNFSVLESLGNGIYSLEAEEPGDEANEYEGALLPIDHIEGLATATMYGKPILGGEEAESDEELRQRYFYYLSHEPKNGSAAQYAFWADSFAGIGRARVFPLWSGANTVKVSILSSDFKRASSELIAAFQEYLDPGGLGLGNGMAPIGAMVTVSTASEKTVNIAGTFSLAAGYGEERARAMIQEAIDGYFSESAYTKTTMNAIGIGAALLDLDAVESVSSLTLNGGAYVSLAEEEIPVTGIIALEVIP